jgi:hypothetical protein
MSTDFKISGGALTFELSGVAEVLKTIADMRNLVMDSEVRAAFQAAGTSLAYSVRKEAPQTKYPYAAILKTKRTSSKPGLLKRSIVGKAFNLGSWRRWGPGAFAQVTLRTGAANSAPHANIIVPGRRALTARKRRMVFLGSAGAVKFRKTVAAVPPNPFWQRGILTAGPRAVDKAKRGIERAWNKRAK